MGIYNVNDIYQWVYSLANQYQSGQWSDDNFNLAMKFANVELLRSETGLPEQYQAGNPQPLISWQITNVISDDLRPFIKPVVINQNANGYFPYPSDYAAFSSLWYEYKLNPIIPNGTATSSSRYIEPVSDDELRTRLTSNIKSPNFLYPIVAWYDAGFQVYPEQIKKVELTYLRFPRTPVWGYTILNNGQTQYDPLVSVQPEYPDTLIPNFTMRICKYLSINIREEELYSMIEQRLVKGE